MHLVLFLKSPESKDLVSNGVEHGHLGTLPYSNQEGPGFSHSKQSTSQMQVAFLNSSPLKMSDNGLTLLSQKQTEDISYIPGSDSKPLAL